MHETVCGFPGYFAMADPNQEIYSKATEPFDPRKKGGRYKNEFIWNTNWQVRGPLGKVG